MTHIRRTALRRLLTGAVCLCLAVSMASAQQPGDPADGARPTLRSIIAALPAAVAEKLPEGALTALPADPAQPNLVGYATHMIEASLRLDGRAVVRATQPMPAPPGQAPETLPRCYAGLLSRSDADSLLLVELPRPGPDGQTQLQVNIYSVREGNKVDSLTFGCALPEPLRQMGRVDPDVDMRKNDWLRVFRVLFAGAEAAPENVHEALTRAHARYTLRAGLWAEAAGAFKDLTATPRDRDFMHYVFCLQRATRMGEAQKAVTEAIKMHPDSGPLYALNAWLALHGPRPEDALPLIEQARRSDMTREGLYVYAHGLILLALGDDDTAEQSFVRAAGLLPDQAFAQVRVARLYRAAGKTELALRAYRAAADAAGTDVHIWAELALALEGADQLAGAVGTLRRAFQQSPANAHVARSLSGLLRRQGNYKAALTVLATAARAAACNPDLHADQGDAATAMWRLQEAADAYRRAMATARNGHHAPVSLARIYRLRRQYTEAGTVLEEALQAHPDDAELKAAALVEKAALCTVGSQPEAALELLEDAAALPQTRPETARALVAAYAAVGTPEANQAALRHAQLAVAGGETPETMAALAHALLASGKPEKALAAAKAALERNPRTNAALIAAARAHVKLKDVKAAADAMEQALEVNPYDAEALEMAGRVALLSGNPARCAELWARAVELNRWDASLHRMLADVLSEQLGRTEDAGLHRERSAELQKLSESYTCP